jgi:phosphatidylserine/phosphatidylglycerophosphate/cardiolipin synthase-like enzyme
MGVHHQKMAIFDNRVIIGGANMSQSYFLNRKDRYM